MSPASDGTLDEQPIEPRADPAAAGSAAESTLAWQVAHWRSESRIDRSTTREAVWALIIELRNIARSDHDAADGQLNELFRLGVPVSDLDGPTDGILVMTTTNPVTDAAVRAVTRMWMPWRGKRFDNSGNTGDNRMTDSSSVVSKLLWPLYSMKDAASGRLAFDFKTYTDAGKDDPDRDVMVIDYSDIDTNPRLVIRSIRDELVSIVPGVYLGKILFRLPSGTYSKIGYFALRADR